MGNEFHYYSVTITSSVQKKHLWVIPFINVLVGNSKENKSCYSLPGSPEDSGFLRLRLFCDWETVNILVWFPGTASAFFSQLLSTDVSETSFSPTGVYIVGLLLFSVKASAKTSHGYKKYIHWNIRLSKFQVCLSSPWTGLGVYQVVSSLWVWNFFIKGLPRGDELFIE